MLVVQGKLSVQSPLRMKIAKAKCKKACTKELTKKIHIQTAQTRSLEINFEMQLALNNFTKQI